MAFVFLTRPDGSPVGVDPAKVISFAPVPPPPSPLAGPLREGTRIVFANKTHQDVVELVQEVARRFKNAAAEAIDAMMAVRTQPIEMIAKVAGHRTSAKPPAKKAPSGKAGARRAAGR